MTLTYELDLDILLPDFHIKVLPGRESETDRQAHCDTHRQCQNYYTHHVRDVGCKEVEVYS